jgi:hypothetical protein
MPWSFDDEARELFLGGNAERLFQLEERAPV